MATLTTHTLDAVQGTHADRVPVVLRRLGPDGTTTVFARETDAGGRLSATVDARAEAEYELVFGTGSYFERFPLPAPGHRIVGDVVLRFRMPDPEGHYHMPVVLSPNGYSVWWSS